MVSSCFNVLYRERRGMCRGFPISVPTSEWTAVSVLTWKPTRARCLHGMSLYCQHCPIKTASRFSSCKVNCLVSGGGEWNDIHQFVELRSIENTSISFYIWSQWEGLLMLLLLTSPTNYVVYFSFISSLLCCSK